MLTYPVMNFLLIPSTASTVLFHLFNFLLSTLSSTIYFSFLFKLQSQQCGHLTAISLLLDVGPPDHHPGVLQGVVVSSESHPVDPVPVALVAAVMVAAVQV